MYECKIASFIAEKSGLFLGKTYKKVSEESNLGQGAKRWLYQS